MALPPLRRNAPPAHWRRVVVRESDPEHVAFRSEVSGRSFRFRIPTGKSALASLPADDFPVTARFRHMLAEGVQRIDLSGAAMRRLSPPARSDAWLSDGSNLPHIVNNAQSERPDRYAD